MIFGIGKVVPGLLYSTDYVILYRAVLVQYWLVTDGQTDRQTYNYSIYP